MLCEASPAFTHMLRCILHIQLKYHFRLYRPRNTLNCTGDVSARLLPESAYEDSLVLSIRSIRLLTSRDSYVVLCIISPDLLICAPAPSGDAGFHLLASCAWYHVRCGLRLSGQVHC